MKPREAIGTLQPGDHVYFMRENGDELIVSLLEDGLEKNQLCCYIGDNISALKKELKNTGHQLEFLHPEVITKERFDPLHAIVIVKEYVKKAEEGGFSGLRVVQEMSWISRKVAGWEKYIEYEKLLNALCSQHEWWLSAVTAVRFQQMSCSRR